MFLEALGQSLLELLFLSLLVQTVLLNPVQFTVLLHILWSLVLLVIIHGQIQGIQHIYTTSTTNTGLQLP